MRSLESRSICRSSQQVRVAPGEILWVPVFKSEVSSISIVEKIKVEHFSAQGEQDCNVVLEVGDHDLFKTGKYNDPLKTKGTFNPRFPKEDRTQGSALNYSGGLLTSSSASGDTNPDNFGNCFPYRAICKENQDIYWKVINQSAIYHHVVLLSASGWRQKNGKR